MGSSTSQLQDAFQFLTQFKSDESVQSLLTHEITSLTYEEFQSLISQLNKLSNAFESKGKQLIFAVKKGTDSTVFWKATVQIACVRFDSKTKKIDSYRLLTLSQFLKVFKTLKCQSMAGEQSSKNAEAASKLTVSHLFDDMDDKFTLEKQNECCICLERKQEVILPCAHSYCVPCLEEWSENHDTCPICRERFNCSEDTWVLSDFPDADEISKEIKENLLELTQTSHKVSRSSSSSSSSSY